MRVWVEPCLCIIPGAVIRKILRDAEAALARVGQEQEVPDASLFNSCTEPQPHRRFDASARVVRVPGNNGPSAGPNHAFILLAQPPQRV